MEDKPAAAPFRISTRPTQVAAALALAIIAGGSTVFAFAHRAAEEPADVDTSSSAVIEEVAVEETSSSQELVPVTDKSIIDAVGAPEGSTVLDANVKLWYIDLNGQVREFDNATTGLRSPAPILKKGGAVLFEKSAQVSSEDGETVEYLALDQRYLDAFLADVAAYEAGETEFTSVLAAVTNPGAYLQTLKGVSTFFESAGYAIDAEITKLVVPVSGIVSTVDEITSGHMPEISEGRAAAEYERTYGSSDGDAGYDNYDDSDSDYDSTSEGGSNDSGSYDSDDSYDSYDSGDSDSYDSNDSDDENDSNSDEDY